MQNNSFRRAIINTPLLGVRFVQGNVLQQFDQINEILKNKEICFAEPVLSDESITWYTDLPGEIKQYTTLSENEQKEISFKIKAQLQTLEKTIQSLDNKFSQIIKAALEIPSLENIFIIGEHIVLTQWGMIEDQFDAQHGLLQTFKSLEPEPSEQPVERVVRKPRKNFLWFLIPLVLLLILLYNKTVTLPETPDTSVQEDLRGKVGTIRINLAWDNCADLDLYVIDPCNNKISHGNKEAICQNIKGILDLDMNVNNRLNCDEPQENVHWESEVPSGQYQVMVRYYEKKKNSGRANYKVTVIRGSTREEFTGSLAHEDEPNRVNVTTFTVGNH